MAYFNFTVDEQEAETRLDKFLAKKLPKISRSYLQKSQFKVNERIVTKNFRLKANDKVWLALPALKDLAIQAEKIPLEIIFEDSEVLVINKPAGMLCHPTDRGGQISGTLINALLFYFRKTQTPFGLVHRLDRETSGLLLIAKTVNAKKKLAQQFYERSITKRYLALVSGRLKALRGLIEAPLIRHPVKRTSQKIAADGREARTEFQVLAEFAEATLLKINLLTGRTHQIRVHLKSLQHPVLGDQVYGFPRVNQQLKPPRLFLHAYYLRFRHPKLEQEINLEIPLPRELKDFLTSLRSV